MSWLLQILLSEILGVPSTLETGTKDAKLNFYDSDLRFDYGKSNVFDAMVYATNHGCSSAKTGVARTGDGPAGHHEEQGEEEEVEYQPCGHVLPEAWPERLLTILGYEKEGILEPHHF